LWAAAIAEAVAVGGAISATIDMILSMGIQERKTVSTKRFVAVRAFAGRQRPSGCADNRDTSPEFAKQRTKTETGCSA